MRPYLPLIATLALISSGSVFASEPVARDHRVAAPDNDTRGQDDMEEEEPILFSTTPSSGPRSSTPIEVPSTIRDSIVAPNNRTDSPRDHRTRQTNENETNFDEADALFGRRTNGAETNEGTAARRERGPNPRANQNETVRARRSISRPQGGKDEETNTDDTIAERMRREAEVLERQLREQEGGGN